MPESGLPLGALVFTVVVTVAIVILVTDTYAEVVMFAALGLSIWHLVTIFGPSVALAVVLLMCAIVFRAIAVVFEGEFGSGMTAQVWISFLDALIGSQDRSEQNGDDRDRP